MYRASYERNVLDRIFPDWKKVAEYQAQPTINSICKDNLNLDDSTITEINNVIETQNLFHVHLAICERIHERRGLLRCA